MSHASKIKDKNLSHKPIEYDTANGTCEESPGQYYNWRTNSEDFNLLEAIACDVSWRARNKKWN